MPLVHLISFAPKENTKKWWKLWKNDGV
jgi:hypothetical protein